MRATYGLAVLSGVLALFMTTGAPVVRAAAAQDHDHAAGDAHEAGVGHEAGEHTHPEAAKLANPVKPTAAAIAAGQKIFSTQCVACHGAAAKGDGKMAAEMQPPPPDLTDATWKHGSSDGEIFTLIRDGSKGTGMKGYGGKMSAQDIWNVVTYLRSIGPNPPHPSR